jgi:flagellar hook-basal body complex protein FliE
MQTASISNAIAGATGSDPLSSSSNAANSQTPFSGVLKSAIGSVQNLEDQAANTVEGLMTGQGVDVHQAMIATQKADMSFEMALAVRSKAVAAYQQVMQMQF